MTDLKKRGNIKIGPDYCGRTRREFLHTLGGGFTSLALTGLLSWDGFFNNQAVADNSVISYTNPLTPKDPHFTPKAKRVIFLFMYGGPSHIDTFDYKPKMYGLDGKTVKVRTSGRGGQKNEGRIVELGSHNSLMSVDNGYYKGMVDKSMGDKIMID